jgi:hypothetical protein
MEAQTFSLCLKEAPKSTVTITLDSGSNTRLEKCVYTFTPQNYNQPQIARIYAAGAMEMAKSPRSFSTNVTAVLKSADKNAKFHGCQSVLKIEREYIEPRRCKSAGTNQYASCLS